MKRSVFAGPIAAMAFSFAVGGAANAAIFSDRPTFESSITIQANEGFENCGGGTASFTGPLNSANPQCSSFTAGLEISSESNDLFIAAPGQSTNPTTALGSNFPTGDSLTVALGGAFGAFGVDLFQNDGGGSQFAGPVDYLVTFLLGAAVVDSLTVPVAPNGGSFFGYTSASPFDTVTIFSQADSFEVIDNVTFGDGSVSVPAPATLTLLLAGLTGLGLAARRRLSGRATG